MLIDKRDINQEYQLAYYTSRSKGWNDWKANAHAAVMVKNFKRKEESYYYRRHCLNCRKSFKATVTKCKVCNNYKFTRVAYVANMEIPEVQRMSSKLPSPEEEALAKIEQEEFRVFVIHHLRFSSRSHLIVLDELMSGLSQPQIVRKIKLTKQRVNQIHQVLKRWYKRFKEE